MEGRDYQVNIQTAHDGPDPDLRLLSIYHDALWARRPERWYLFKHSADISQDAAIYQDLRDQVLYVILNSGVLLLVYFPAWRISGWMFADDEPVAWSGDPFELALPALQITGLVFLTKALAGLVPVIHTFYQQQLGPAVTALDPQFWDDAWSVCLYLLLGFLFFRNPRWLVDRMRRFSKESH